MFPKWADFEAAYDRYRSGQAALSSELLESLSRYLRRQVHSDTVCGEELDEICHDAAVDTLFPLSAYRKFPQALCYGLHAAKFRIARCQRRIATVSLEEVTGEKFLAAKGFSLVAFEKIVSAFLENLKHKSEELRWLFLSKLYGNPVPGQLAKIIRTSERTVLRRQKRIMDRFVEFYEDHE